MIDDSGGAAQGGGHRTGIKIIRRAEGLQCREERGLFDQHAVARIDECTHDKIDALLGTGKHHHVSYIALHAACAHMLGK